MAKHHKHKKKQKGTKREQCISELGKILIVHPSRVAEAERLGFGVIPRENVILPQVPLEFISKDAHELFEKRLFQRWGVGVLR